MAGTRPWSSRAVGRSWRARFRSSSMAWFTRRLSSPTSCACSGGPSWASASRRSRIAVRAWFTSSWRSRARRRRSSSWARITSCPERRRSCSTRSSRRRNESARRLISSAGFPGGSSSETGFEGSACSMRSMRRSSGRKRRWSIHMFTQRVSMIARASTRNCQRWWSTFRSRPATSAAARSVRATSSTLAATTWPMSESSRRVILGLDVDRKVPMVHKWGRDPISASRRSDENPRRSFGGLRTTSVASATK